MRHMGVAALYPKRRTSAPGRGHKVYPYLLTGVSVERANQVWATDICYLPMAKGFLYLVAVMDWLSRRVLSWRVSNTLDREFCVEALEEALARYGAPEIFNTDQGAQFTSEAFTDVLKAHGVAISMDGKGRWIDNVFIERLWRSVKYEDIYLRAYETPAALRAGLTRYFDFYNTRRRHTALDRRTPDAVYFEQVAVMDWLSRRVLSWRVSNTLDREFCVEALEEALARYGAPEIFNTDQGAQFTSEAFTDVLKAHGVAISMDGKGRWIDNVFIERLWRSVKYEDIYLRAYETPAALRAGLTRYFDFYNTRRRHTALDRRTPDAVYFEQVAVNTAA